MIKSCVIWRVAQLVAMPALFYGVVQFLLLGDLHAVGIYKDEFWPVPRRSGSGTIFAVPEIMVGLKDALSSNYGGLEAYKVERWERILADRGYIVGYVKRSESGKLQMCACTKYKAILSAAVQSEIDLKRQMQPGKITDFEDLELDKKIENDCLDAGTYQGCVDFTSILPNPPEYCNVFYKELNRKVVPLSFSKQSYFDPGLRMMQKMANASGSGRYFGASDVYIGEYDGYASGKRDRGQTRFVCPGLGLLSTVIHTIATGSDSLHSICDIPDADDVSTGYAVIKRGEEVCLNHLYGGAFVSDCVPGPSLSAPKVTAALNGLRIKFPNCKNRHGADSEYCDFTLASGESDPVFNFAVIKPKLNDGAYSLQVLEVCTGYSKAEDKCSRYSPKIVSELHGNVTCFISPGGGFSWSYLRRGDRYYWLRELPNMLVAHGFDPGSNRRVQCGDEKSIDLAELSQGELDKMHVQGRSLSFPEVRTGSNIDSEVLCHSRLTYSYTSHRAFLHDGACAPSEKDGVVPGYCRSKYESLDNFEKVFLSENELPSARHVFSLNPILQGHCVSNFPSHEYKVIGHQGAPSGGKVRQSYTLEVSRQNTTCDLLKIEMWGAGESGSLHTGRAGRNGEYVLGILRLNLNPQEQKFLKIKVGVGGSADIKKKGGGNDAGANTEVFLCDSVRDNGNCTIKLFAKGGGQASVPVSQGLGEFVHYRVFEGLKALNGTDKVFIPYQDPSKYEGYASANEVGCVRGGTAASTGIKTVPISDKFPGAGGCARADINVLQGGANGMVKITCEKWSGPAGRVKQWEEVVVCNKKLQDDLQEIVRHHRIFNFSGETESFLNRLAMGPACSAISRAPSFVIEVENILDFLKKSVHPRVTTQQLIDTEVTKLLNSLDNKLADEPGLLSDLASVLSDSKDLSEQEVRTKINAAFSEVLGKKADVFKDIGTFSKITEQISRKAGNEQSLKTTLAMMTESDYVESFVRDEKVIKTLEYIANTLKRVHPLAFYLEEGRQRAVDDVVSNYKDIIRKRPVFAQKLGARLTGSKLSEKPLDDAELEAVIMKSAAGVERLYRRKTEVLSPKEGDLLKKLHILRKESKGLDARSKRIFEKMDSVDFARKVASCERFDAEVKKVIEVLEKPAKSLKSANAVEAEIENSMNFLIQALDAEPEVTKAYIEVVEYRNRTKHFTRDELIAAFRKIYEKHLRVSK
ncbi:hypothetical protein ANPL_04270 [Anaplasma platys]|uniref:Uncharacterized protein n=1 Tax=Anaplasma platys TaxID=949 RepID=A0A858PZA7_9RICK|nr:hypothetical protein [Anaplasma platys]QJC27900.1 hypothetical protein ANPL_04270 [Anaplasma platys]